MTKRIPLPALILGLTGTLFVVTSQADSLRCGQKLVSSGASLYQVKSVCGEPDDARHRTEFRTLRQHVAGPCAPGGVRCGTVIERTVEVSIDEWTYDFGPRKFMQHLLFEQGELVRVQDGDYGHKDD